MNNNIKMMNLELEKGLYIISSPYHQKDDMRKFGMSEHLNERLHGYNVGGEYYEYGFIFIIQINYITRIIISFIFLSHS